MAARRCLPSWTVLARAGSLMGPVLCLVVSLSPPLAAGAPQPTGAPPALRAVADLARAGAPDLALRRLAERQPDVRQDPGVWAQWERARFHILQQKEAWGALTRRAEAAPSAAPDAFHRWARVEAAKAYLQQGKGTEARALLRRLLWRTLPRPDANEQRRWRRLIIRSYLVDGRVDDAHTAMLRYRQDYGGEGDWRLLRARVLIQAGRSAEAADLLATPSTPESRALALLARLRAGRAAPAAVAEAASKLADPDDADPGVVALALTVIAQAAEPREDGPARIRALESLMGLPRAVREREPLVTADADTLWQAYVDHGLALGNRHQLLVGADGQWYMTASDLYQKSPLAARALFSVLALRSDDAKHRALAHEYFAALVADGPGGDAALSALYLRSEHFPSVEAIPPVVRHRLVDHALAQADIPLASKLMAGLDEPPRNSEPVRWRLRQARVFVLGGHPAEGVAVLEGLLAEPGELSTEQVDRLLQVIFDLQNLERHEAALALLGRLQGAKLDRQRRRERLFWMADSHKAVGRYEVAAFYYMQSATLGDPFAMDQWARSARFHAAEMLARAGLTADARRVYQQLLDAAEDPARRALLRRRLEHVGQMEGSGRDS